MQSINMESPIVSVEQGQLRGRKALDHYGGTYYSFQGIPFAKPPLGELRFKAPQPPEKWDGIWDATQERDECFSHHMVFRHIVGSEDCLFLNVYTPALPKEGDSTPLKPVMVWIHGGAFTAGSSKTEIYGPDFLIAEDVVVVTINYRLGILGFLSLEDSSLGVPGNAGFKDMVMALKWVRKNIRNFKGDPNNVTIFGESAGGASVHLLMLSPMAKGLFHRVIAQSGCALNIWAHGSRVAKEIAEKLGMQSDDEKEILKFLQEVPVEELLKAQDKIPDPLHACDVRPVGPVVEDPSAEEAFLTDTPINIILSGKYNKVPLMTGFTDREGMLFDISCARAGIPRLTEDFELFVPYHMRYPKGSEKSKAVAKKIKDFYFGDSPVTMENLDKDYMLRTDLYFLRGIYITVRNHLATSTTPIYLYRMTVECGLNFYKQFAKSTWKGVCHADDLGYLFKTAITPPITEGSLEEKSMKRMVKLWANFARYANPNPIKKEPLIPVTWHPVKEGEYHFLDIGDELLTGVNPDAERMKFWDEVYAAIPELSKL